jgi:hypothetical protein
VHGVVARLVALVEQAVKLAERARVARRTQRAGHTGGRPRAATLRAPRTAAPSTLSCAGRAPRRELWPRATVGKQRMGARGGARPCRAESAEPPRERRAGGLRTMARRARLRAQGGSEPEQGGVARSLEGRTAPGRGSSRGDEGMRTRPQPRQTAPRARRATRRDGARARQQARQAGATRRGHAAPGEPRTVLVALAAMGEPRTTTNARTRTATKKKGGGKGKGEGGFTSTGADELRASSKLAIRFSLRGVERERSFGLRRGERRPVSLTRRRGRGCCGGWCARAVGGVEARLLGGPGAQGAGGERSRGRSRLGHARERSLVGRARWGFGWAAGAPSRPKTREGRVLGFLLFSI